ncbi:MAG: hypothetical protein E2O68_04675 [Deltaproteobacteria bacterium]|nr:MAG: hypothetical protein E2O68_04675 [Deltaproteobacteria bacterium]
MKKKALSFEGEITKELKSYRRAQKRYANRAFKTSTLPELFESIERSDIIYLGDFHTFDQNSKNLERILKNLIKKEKKLVFGLEFIFANRQKYIDLYLDGHLTELEFLESINYFQSWRFPWKHYSFLFNFAKQNDLPMLALNSSGTLDKRDQFAANNISNFLKEHPQYKMLVLFGELHIMPNKIPKLVSHALDPDHKQLIIHQNLDDIFWKLQKESSIIKFNDWEYSLQASPPWIKYESMIYWFENILEDPEFDLHEYILEKKGTLSGNLNEKFLFLCHKINEGLELGISAEELENFNIFGQDQMDFVLEKLDTDNFHKQLITGGKSFCLPESFNYYLPNFSVNKISMIIGFHIKNLLNGPYKSQGKSKFFSYYVGIFFIAHFCAKILNPYKKCDLYLDLIQKINSKNFTKEEKATFKTSIEVIDNISRHQDITQMLEKLSYYNLYLIAEIIGPFLSDIFYKKIDSYSMDEKKYIQQKMLFSNPSVEELPALFNIILNELEYDKLKKDYF